jgi:hypothetical protein
MPNGNAASIVVQWQTRAQQRDRMHQMSRGTETALEGPALGELRPQIRALLDQSLQRGDVTGQTDGRDAAHSWFAVDQHGAGSALAATARQFRRGQAQVVP